MGVTDYGITPAGSSYSYDAAEMGAYANISKFAIQSSSPGDCLDSRSNHCMTFQENTIATGIEIKNSPGEYWAQDVAEVAKDGSCASPCVSGDYSVTWLDNIWNFSGGGYHLATADVQGNLTGGCSSSGVGKVGGDEYWYCVGPTDYGLTLPFSTWAMTGTGPNANAYYGGCTSSTDSCIQFWGAIFEGTSEPYYGWFDQVEFKAGKTGGGTPRFYVANATSPDGLPYDAEWVIAGPGGGAAATLGSAKVTLDSEYNTGAGSTMNSTGTWHHIKHAWSSGYDTAESVSNVLIQDDHGRRFIASASKGTENPRTSLW